MASIKYKGVWYESTSLPLEIKIELGLSDEVIIDLDEINPIVKNAPCKKGKSKVQVEEPPIEDEIEEGGE